MRWRVLFFVSLGVNVAALAAWLLTNHRLKVQRAPVVTSVHPASTIKTNVVLRRQFFSWSEVESSDYPTYIANLRNIDCPEQTIRDIIIADVNALYARRIATEIVTPDQQWWRSEPDTNVLRIALESVRRLEDERRGLLTRLLGADWESGDLVNLPRPSHPGVTLDGPVLGVLSPEIKQALEDISRRADERLQAYLSAQRQQGKSPDPVELARLRQQTRDELQRLLAPPQVEEYLLRYSQNAIDLRTELGQLAYFNATPDEFRSIFRATDLLDQQLQLLAGSNDPNSALQRRNLEQQRETSLRNALGATRYEQFRQLHDPVYRDAVAAANQAGSPDSAQTLYEINLATAQQQALVRANTNLTAEQRAVEQARIELERSKALAQAVGQDVPADPAPAVTTPAPPPLPLRTHPYVFAVGDTIGSVAQRYGVSMNALRVANPDIDFRRVRPGQTILVPDSLPPLPMPPER
jgi:LysM repeat protein